MKNKIKTLITALALSFQAFVMPFVSADFLNVRAYGTDTVAGYAAMLETSLINPGQNVVFVVEKPDMSVVRIPASADMEGVAAADLYGHQTKLAGNYKVAVLFPGSPDSSPQNGFTVFSGPVSVTQSDITSTRQMVTADGREKTFVTVTLYDEYRNPIPNHQVRLISSRGEDEVSVLSGGITNSEGRANFKIISEYPGISVYTALDATLNQVLADREEIVFYAPVRTEPIGGNYFSADLLGTDIGQADSGEVIPGPVNSFDIDGLPSVVRINTDYTITVTAKDKDGNMAKNYTGTILISTPDDEHAVLPSNGEYSFKESDQGKFTFNLALRFSKVGDQTIQVLDKDNWKIAGERQLETRPEQDIVDPDLSSTLLIKSPIDGAELGNSFIIISGQGDPNIYLKIFDNDIKIGDSETDSDGFFSFQAQNLISGGHEFYAMSDDGDVSPSVMIQIDTLPPVLNYFEISPDGSVDPGGQLTVTVRSEPYLEEAKIRIQGAEEVLFPDDPGTYTAIVAAPVMTGSYPIDVILIDSLANKSEFLNKAVVDVTAEEVVYPPQVNNLAGEAGDAQVTLSWDEITDHTIAVQNYRIHYGTDLDQLDQVMDTEGAVMSLTIEELENDKQYFFNVYAIDVKGLESKEESITIAVTPVAPVDDDPIDDPIDDSDSIDIVPGGFIQGSSSSPDSVTLNWEPFPGINAYFYKVYLGLEPLHYDDYVITPNNTPTTTIKDLIPNIPYYFAVVALDLTGNEISPLSEEFSATPGGGGLHPAGDIDPDPNYFPPDSSLDNDQLHKVPATEKTGPETMWIVVISLVVAHALYQHKKRITRLKSVVTGAGKTKLQD